MHLIDRIRWLCCRFPAVRGQVRSYGLRPESKAGLRITIKWWRSGLCPQGVEANLFAKALFRAIHLLRMSRPFRGQVRSYGLRPESKAGLRITIKWWRSGLCPQGVELVRESFISGDTSPADVTALSRTSPLLRPSARIQSRLVYNDKMVAFRLLPAGRVGTCSRKLYFGRYIFCGCHGPFADKSAPWPSARIQRRLAYNFERWSVGSDNFNYRDASPSRKPLSQKIHQGAQGR